MKIVINKRYGGFSISLKCAQRMAELGHKEAKKEIAEYEKTLKNPTDPLDIKYGVKWYGMFMGDDKKRKNKILVQAVEELGDEANGQYAKLEVVDIPKGVDFNIENYDGMESIHENHRSWY